MKRALLGIALVLAAPLCSAQKIKVWIQDTADDQVGSRLVYAIKEQIRKSAALELTEDEEVTPARVGIHIVTIDRDKEGRSTSYAVTWTVGTLHKYPVDMFLTQAAGGCGVNRVEQCANGLVADTDKQAAFARRLLKN